MSCSFLRSRKPLLFVLLLCCGCENGIPWVTFRPLWHSDFRRRLRDVLCVADSAYRTCFATGEEVCSAWITEGFDFCYQQVESQLPFFIVQPEDGRNWGAQIGGCVGDRYHELHKELFANNEACGVSTRKYGAVSTAHQVLLRYQGWLESSPLARVVIELDPSYDEKFRALFIDAGLGLRDAQALLSRAVIELQIATFPLSSDTAILNYARAHLSAMKALVKENSELCRMLFFAPNELREPQRTRIGSFNLNGLFDTRTNAIVAAIRSGTRKEGVAADSETTAAGVAEIEAKMREKNASGSTNGSQSTCEASIAFYDTLLQLPPEKMAPMLKTLLSIAAKNSS